MTPRVITLHYRRLPDRLQTFTQSLLAETADCLVTFLEGASTRRPLTVAGRVILEPGSPVVWFTYPGRWYDIGRFHLADGTFTGFYANLLTPVAIDGDEWSTTDLCLDVWSGADGSVALLDEDEFQEAVREGWIDVETAERVREEAENLLLTMGAGGWPPSEVTEWTLERARREIGLSSQANQP